ncbi:sigma 54-interacting transcriptional regulator [Fictibacillus sp. b24]|uniref:sigma-54 interaction domain-containing protein n=1 Tax=Fictibacillus sp. b24 TaxID=3055863 RepID=UPI0025A16401|nr:sigma 54-interacting transcriptional regulator [Fictibacillus sp. b24]MDM5316360.1 sigma 54-interacting transcriptional regulator [Fictibacillus sp. b24]
MITGSMETAETLNAILKTIDEGIHVVDADGITIFYNSVAATLDGLTPDEVHNCHVLEAFPSLTTETSTLLKVIQTGKPIFNEHQSYTNRKGKQIDTVNSTLPLWLNGELIGAVEVAKDLSKIKQLSEQLLDLQSKMKRLNKSHKNQTFASYHFSDIITNDSTLDQVKKQCEKASQTQSPIMIYGETGTGKEMFVQAIHNSSKRSSQPFVVQNCAAIPGPLLEGILFGTTKGSFTGAIDRPGVFELADGGTLFLDELNSMPVELQAKLLRVVQEGVVQRVGSHVTRKIDVRIISALNEKPEECMNKGSLRHDLFYRLNVVYFELPPLRERKRDISFLIQYFVTHFNAVFQKKVEGITDEAEQVLQNYSWPGNVRELKHAIEHSMNFSEDYSLIGLELLPKHVAPSNATIRIESTPDLSTVPPLRKALGDYEQQIIQMALKQTSGNILQAAKILGVPRQTLQYKIKQR